MNLDLDDTERALQEGLRDLRERRLTPDRVRSTPRAELWKDLDAAGVFSLREDAGLVATAVVFEELGRSLVPGPLVATALAGGGRVVASVERGPDVVVAADADELVVVDDDGLWRTDPPAGTPVAEPLDPLTPLQRVAELPQGERIGDADDADRWRRESHVLRAALLVGIAGETTALAAAYARERHQFGRPIGSFQAVKHLCADMLVRAEVARAAVYAAAVTAAWRDVDGAILVAAGAGRANAKACVQVHGGMGFTWELPVHLFLKRAAVLAAESGDPAARLAARL